MKMTKQYFCILCIFMMILPGLISTIHSKMNVIRTQNKLTTVEPLENAPPMMVVTTIMLGGFRGLLADILFLRLQNKKNSENFFEMVQLSEWIVNLQPRFTGAASFLAWNMAYNVSVVCKAPEDRWRWVNHGIKLLRDNALTYNLSDPLLYWELGWLYQHKIGQVLDDANRYYKVALAKEMHRIIGDGDEYFWNELSLAPLSSDQFLLALKNNRSAFEEILFKEKLTLDQLALHFRRDGKFSDSVSLKLRELNILKISDNYFRATWLRDEYRLDPALVSAVLEKYGYLDFRLPESHSLFWAHQGLKLAENDLHIKCERMIFQSLKTAFNSGKLLYFDGSNTVNTMPNVTLCDAVRNAYSDTMKRHGAGNYILSGYENFMIDAVIILYTFGLKEKAEQYLESLRDMPEISEKSRFNKALSAFVIDELSKDINNMSLENAQSTIQALILKAYQSICLHEIERANGFDMLARKVYKNYMSKMANEADINRRGLPEFQHLKVRMLQYFRSTIPENIQQVLDREITKFNQ